MERNNVYRVRVDEVAEVKEFLRGEGFEFDVMPHKGTGDAQIYERTSGRNWIQRLSDFMADKRDTAQGYFLDFLGYVYVVPYPNSRLEGVCEKYIAQQTATGYDYPAFAGADPNFRTGPASTGED